MLSPNLSFSKITGPNEEQILTFPQTSEQRFSFVAQSAGIYKMCASNPATFVSKQISLVTDVSRRAASGMPFSIFRLSVGLCSFHLK